MAARAGSQRKEQPEADRPPLHAVPAGQAGTASAGQEGDPATAEPDESVTRAPLDRVVDAPPRDRGGLFDIAAWAVMLAAKAATIGFAVDGLRHADSPKLRGKGIRRRFFGYVIGVFLVPLVWRLSRHPGPYPRGLDVAVSMPLLIDAAGNSLGMYQEAHVDDVVHFANSAVVAGVASALLAPKLEKPWHAAAAGAAFSMCAEITWEIVEFSAMKLGADGLQLTYEDTMEDIIESWLGAMVGGAFALLRHRTAADRRSTGSRARTSA